MASPLIQVDVVIFAGPLLLLSSFQFTLKQNIVAGILLNPELTACYFTVHEQTQLNLVSQFRFSDVFSASI